MAPEQIVKILHKTGAFRVNHSGRTLADHLLNTYELLVHMNAPMEACLAGAFHSIYGTNVFKNAIVAHEQRDQIKSLITPEVENLVYLFSTINRPHGIDSGVLISHQTRQIIEVDADTLLKLRYVEIANLLEQKCSLMPFPTLYKMYKNGCASNVQRT